MKPDIFRKRLKLAMGVQGLNQADLAKDIGLSRGMITHYINGTNQPRFTTITKIANRLGVDTLWLMGLNAPMINQPLDVLGEKIFALAKFRKINLEKRLGLSPSTILSWNSRNIPDMATMRQIADALSFDVEELIGREITVNRAGTRILATDEVRLVDLYRRLNILGRERLLERSEEMSEMPKYTQKSES